MKFVVDLSAFNFLPSSWIVWLLAWMWLGGPDRVPGNTMDECQIIEGSWWDLVLFFSEMILNCPLHIKNSLSKGPVHQIGDWKKFMTQFRHTRRCVGHSTLVIYLLLAHAFLSPGNQLRRWAIGWYDTFCWICKGILELHWSTFFSSLCWFVHWYMLQPVLCFREGLSWFFTMSSMHKTPFEKVGKWSAVEDNQLWM